MGRRGAPPPSDEVEITVHHPRRGPSPPDPSPEGAHHGRRRPSSHSGQWQGQGQGQGQGGGRQKGDEFRPFRRWIPVLVPVFVVVNIAMFAVTMYVNDCPKSDTNAAPCFARSFLGRFSFQPLKENPLLGPSSVTLLKMGGLQVNYATRKHEGWRLISCIWLHAGLVHVFANMLSLVFIGIRLEQEFGFLRIGPLYIISGIGGSLLSALFIESTIQVGASGALFGLLGAMLSEFITNWTIYANKFAALFSLVVIIAINLAVGLLPHVDNFAHIGGFITGFLLGIVLLIRPQFGYVNQKNAPLGSYTGSTKKPKYKMYQYVLWVISATLLIVWLIVGLICFFRGVNGNKHCSWCHYLSCVPTSKWSCKARETSCNTSLSGNQLNLTCSDTQRTQTYFLYNPTDSQILQLCTQLCA